jgi:hypothetical protein
MARSRGREERALPEAPPQNDAYTGLLAISLVATLTGLIFVWMDWSDYSSKPPPVKAPASISQVEPSSTSPAPAPPAPEAEQPAPAPPEKGS